LREKGKYQKKYRERPGDQCVPVAWAYTHEDLHPSPALTTCPWPWPCPGLHFHVRPTSHAAAQNLPSSATDCTAEETASHTQHFQPETCHIIHPTVRQPGPCRSHKQEENKWALLNMIILEASKAHTCNHQSSPSKVCCEISLSTFSDLETTPSVLRGLPEKSGAGP
jgi:hypothetical protein